MDRVGNEFYIKEWPELTGKTFGEVAFLFPLAVPVGVVRAGADWKEEDLKLFMDGSKVNPHPLLLNPPDEYIFKEGDKLVVLAEHANSYHISKPAKTSASKLLDLSNETFSINPSIEHSTDLDQENNILICGWRLDMEDVLRELDKVKPKGSVVTILDTAPVADREELLDMGGGIKGGLQNITLRHIVANCAQKSALKSVLREKDFHAVLIMSNDVHYEKSTADSRAVVCSLLVTDILQQKGNTTTKVVTEVKNRHSAEVLNVAKVCDFVVARELTGMTIVYNLISLFFYMPLHSHESFVSLDGTLSLHSPQF